MHIRERRLYIPDLNLLKDLATPQGKIIRTRLHGRGETATFEYRSYYTVPMKGIEWQHLPEDMVWRLANRGLIEAAAKEAFDSLGDIVTYHITDAGRRTIERNGVWLEGADLPELSL